MSERLLVNYWYAHPVGHVIEALRYCLGYKNAQPDARVSVLLNGAAPTQLAACSPFLDQVFAVPYAGFVEPDTDPVLALRNVPRNWDWVIDNHREREASHQTLRGFRAFYDATALHLVAAEGRTWTGGEPPAYLPHQRLQLALPAEERRRAAELVAGRRAISVVLAGHSDPRSFYPSVASWEMILSALAHKYPDAVFCLIGKLHEGQVRSTSTITAGEVAQIAESCPSIDLFDRPLLHQLAVVEASSLFLSPHTGFGFAALSVGTPWLTISGGQWHEYFFNDVPFYSVLPDTTRYPAFGWGAPLPAIGEDIDREGARTVSMSAARLREDLDELLDAADKLINGRWSVEEALTDYFPRLIAAYGGDAGRAFTFDGIGASYM